MKEGRKGFGIRFSDLLIMVVDIKRNVQHIFFTLKRGSGSISEKSKIIPESFRSNFHIIFALREPQEP